MAYINTKIQKWMPQNQRVAVDSSPSLHGIQDTISSTAATPGSATKLPSEFYDSKLRGIIDRITVEEEFGGYKTNAKYRTLGIGALLGEVISRMTDRARTKAISPSMWPRQLARGTEARTPLKMALFSCHDSTIAATLASMGVMEGEIDTWPTYGSSIAIELFKSDHSEMERTSPTIQSTSARKKEGDDFFVRLKYNNGTLVLPGCQEQGRHLENNRGFCTLVSQHSVRPKNLIVLTN